MVRIEAVYEGELRCEAVHTPSGTRLRTDAPKDNQGRGELFSPTDLVATALGTCIATIMGIVADRHGIELEGMQFDVVKVMTPAPPRRIARLDVTFRMPAGIEAHARNLFRQCADGCPVRRSLHPEVEVAVEFAYPD